MSKEETKKEIYAKVTEPFRGLPDGGERVESFEKGDIIEGTLAEAMIAAEKAEKCAKPKAKEEPKNKAAGPDSNKSE